jgi:hypothetical protein
MMGLAVSSRLAARYNIRVELRCDTGEGTTVYITLPSNIVILPRPRGGYEPQGSMQRRVGGYQPLAVPAGPATPMWHDMIPGALPSGPAAGRPPGPPHHLNGAAPRMAAQHMAPQQMAPQQPAPPIPRPAAELLAVPSYGGPRGGATDETAEMPIYQEMEAAWFRDNRSLQMEGTGPTGPVGGWPTDNRAASGQRAAAPTPTPSPNPAPTTAAPMPSRESWATVADDGWRAAMAAAAPTIRTKTRGGLPKRVPQAQLVPGGVETAGSAASAQRSPEDVRGLLSAYHRGVQRGRGAEQPPVTG